MKLAVVTSNPHKSREVSAYFEGILEVEHIELECPEFRHEDVREIAREKARYAYERLGIPLIVDDTAFSVSALRGFPGPYAAYVLSTIGIEGILTLMEGIKNRDASFETAIAFAWQEGIEVFLGRIEGTIVNPRGTGGFGYDPIFEVDGRTFAEYSLSDKSKMSHRGKALAVFRDWVEENLQTIIEKPNC